MQPDALIFNADGTISETDETHRRAFNLSFRDHDLPWHWSHAIYGRMIDALTARSKIESFVTKYRPDDLNRLNDDALITNLVQSKRKRYIDLIERGEAVLRPGVSRLINEAQNAGIKLAIISLSGRQDFEIVLQNHFGLGALAQFNAIVTSEDVKRQRRPKDTLSEIYKRALQLMGADPNQTFAIEARESGSEAARQHGLNVIATPGLYTSSFRFQSADLVLSDLGHPAAPFQIIRGEAGAYHFASVEALKFWQRKVAAVA